MLKFLGLAAAAILGLAASAQADTDFPTKPVTIIVPYAAGGPSDVAARLIAEELQKVWHQPVLIDNRPGGGAVVGMSAVAHARPDGYTWGQISGAFTVNPSIRKSLPYDTAKDFTGLTVFVTSPHALVSYPGFAPNTTEELIAASKKSTLKFASAGIGSSSHMTGELVQSVAGVKWQHIPYNGDTEALADILAGRVDFTISAWSNVLPQIQAGKLKLIAVSYPTRLPSYPNTPTLMEALPGLKTLPVGSWVGLNAPVGVPADVLAKIGEGLKEATSSDDFKQKAAALGVFPGYKTPAEADAFIKNEISSWQNVVAKQHIVVQQ